MEGLVIGRNMLMSPQDDIGDLVETHILDKPERIKSFRERLMILGCKCDLEETL